MYRCAILFFLAILFSILFLNINKLSLDNFEEFQYRRVFNLQKNCS